MANGRTYRGLTIARSRIAENVAAGLKWQVELPPTNGYTFWEVGGRGYRTLAEAREAIREMAEQSK